jgi:hypothetical protein
MTFSHDFLCVCLRLVPVSVRRQAAYELNGEIPGACVSQFETGFNAVLAMSKIVLLVIGMYVTYQIRKVPSHFNESKWLAWTLYNVSFFFMLYNAILGLFGNSMDPNGRLLLLA